MSGHRTGAATRELNFLSMKVVVKSVYLEFVARLSSRLLLLVWLIHWLLLVGVFGLAGMRCVVMVGEKETAGCR